MALPGPGVLGRGVVVTAGGAVPSPWATAPVVVIGEADVADPQASVERLHAAWAERRPVVVALAVDPAVFREPAPDQLAAVAHAGGPARVIAPAGSGKTRVLTERLRHLVAGRGFERETVLGVAYNKKAQQELEERTAAFRPRVQTLNALGLVL